MPEIWDILLGAIGGVTSAIVLEIFRKRLELSADIDIDLRQRRTEMYKILWKKTELLPKWPRATDVTYKKLDNFSKEMRD